MAKIAIIATIRILPGKREEYLKHLAAHRRRCLDGEPGTLAFEIVALESDPDTIMLYEVYADQDAVKAHMTGASMQRARQDGGHLLDGKLTYVRGAPVE